MHCGRCCNDTHAQEVFTRIAHCLPQPCACEFVIPMDQEYEGGNFSSFVRIFMNFVRSYNSSKCGVHVKLLQYLIGEINILCMRFMVEYLILSGS